MEIVTELEWDSDDTAAWNAFLRTRPGQRLLPKMLESAPALLLAGETNAILIKTGELAGFQNAARTLLFLANPPPEVKSESALYPALDDDNAWPDKEKLS